ncbi:MAG TPA: shikimate dehydrogenase [Bacteroidales bacterium]|nr:shikimate dehydrogenase [Bacteroidales bacterium]
MKTYALIGKTLTHSFSKAFFDEKFLRENIARCRHLLAPLPSIDELIPFINTDPTLVGLNVTIPYKEAVLPLLDELDQVAGKVGAVNTIVIKRHGESLWLKGYNTDVFGFQNSCEGLVHAQHALVLGSGGAAKAARYVLQQNGIDYLTVSRNPKNNSQIAYRDVNASLLKNHTLIINTTPLGMFPDIEACPAIPYHLLGSQHFLFDMIYNPAETEFLKRGKAAGATTQNGLLMLTLQAEKAWEIWSSNSEL